MFNRATGTKDEPALGRLIEYHTQQISSWLKMLGYDIEARREFWRELAEKETDGVNLKIGTRPPMPVDLILESGDGLTYQQGQVNWRQRYSLDGEFSQVPYNFPLNLTQAADFQKRGYRISLLPDGSGFNYTTLSTNGDRPSPEIIKDTLENVFHFDVSRILSKMEAEREREQNRYLRQEEVASYRAGQENVGTGGIESESCPT